VIACKAAQFFVTQPVEKFQLGWMRNEVLRFARQLLRDNSGNRFEPGAVVLCLRNINPR
jgi:hypothetical protein